MDIVKATKAPGSDWLRTGGVPEFVPSKATSVIAIALFGVTLSMGFLIHVPYKVEVTVVATAPDSLRLAGLNIPSDFSSIPELQIEWATGSVTGKPGVLEAIPDSGAKAAIVAIGPVEGQPPESYDPAVLDLGSKPILVVLWDGLTS